jgi:hypothetical protein
MSVFRLLGGRIWRDHDHPRHAKTIGDRTEPGRRKIVVSGICT